MRTSILTATLLFAVTILSGQRVMNPTALKTNAILTAVDQMKSDAGYAMKTLNNEQFLEKKNGETGQLIGYLKNGQLAKMNVRIALPACVRTDKYYLQNDSLIMFYRQERVFPYNENTKTYDPEHPIIGMECRYYYDGTQLLKTDTKGDPKCSEKPSEQQAAEMIATCKRYEGLLKK